MPVMYTNRKGTTYTLCLTRTQKGKNRYFFSAKPEGRTLVEQMPDGYEIRENVNGQVSLGKMRPQIITPDEFAAVKRAIAQRPDAKNYRVDVKGKYIIVYENDGPNLDELVSILQEIMPLSPRRIADFRAEDEKYSHFAPMLRFELVDEETRNFSVARMGFSGEGGWLHPARWGTISELASLAIPLLGTDDFFELY